MLRVVQDLVPEVLGYVELVVVVVIAALFASRPTSLALVAVVLALSISNYGFIIYLSLVTASWHELVLRDNSWSSMKSINDLLLPSEFIALRYILN